MGAVLKVVGRAIRELGKVDVLIANAGTNTAGVPLTEMTDEQWRVVIDVNLTETANSIRAVLPHMIENGGGRIVATTSTFGRQGAEGGLASYAASKWGVVGLVKSAALEAAPHNVTVNAVAPTAVNTGFGGGFGSGAEFREADEAMRAYNALPVGIIDPSDVADGVLFLVSDRARYVTGAVLDVAAGANARYTA